MLFSSTPFLFVFLPLVCLGYFLLRKEARNYWLLWASLLFYAWGEPRYLAVMLLIIILNYLAARSLTRFAAHRKILLALMLACNLGILIFFKYTDFLIENVNLLLQTKMNPLHVVMPIGISFFIFQAMSYTLDVYRGEAACQRDIRKLALYISLFPQLIAGPIVKYHDVAADIDERHVKFDDILYGTRRFIIGLAKKVLLANNVGLVADKVYQTGPAGITPEIAWLGAAAYALQIFFDFSGYSDMAIGLGRIFGFHFLENFNYPYIATSMTDFWRRWHISLSTWFKEYLYIPLGGNRHGEARTLRNLFLVFLATGIWHGASWNFVIWGLWHGAFIILEKRLGKTKITSRFGHAYVILVFVLGWVFFRADNLAVAVDYIMMMFGMGSSVPRYGALYYISAKQIFAGILALLFCVPWNLEKLKTSFAGECAYNLGLVALLFLSIASIAASTYNPFIYFRF